MCLAHSVSEKKLVIYVYAPSVCLSVHVSNEISEMVRPRSTKFGMKNSYTCSQIKFISNFECHTLVVFIKLES